MSEEFGLDCRFGRCGRCYARGGCCGSAKETVSDGRIVVSEAMGEKVECFAMATLSAIKNDTLRYELILEWLYTGKYRRDRVGNFILCRFGCVLTATPTTEKLQ